MTLPNTNSSSSPTNTHSPKRPTTSASITRKWSPKQYHSSSSDSPYPASILYPSNQQPHGLNSSHISSQQQDTHNLLHHLYKNPDSQWGLFQSIYREREVSQLEYDASSTASSSSQQQHSTGSDFLSQLNQNLNSQQQQLQQLIKTRDNVAHSLDLLNDLRDNAENIRDGMLMEDEQQDNAASTTTAESRQNEAKDQSLNTSTTTSSSSNSGLERCSQLMKRIGQMEAFISEMRERLSHFNDMERLQQFLKRRGGSVSSPGGGTVNLKAWKQQIRQKSFRDSLSHLDDSIMFLQQHPHYKEASRYLTRYHQLKMKALAYLRDFVVATFSDVGHRIQLHLQEARQRITNANQQNRESTQDSSSSLELDFIEQQYSLLYIEFQTQVEHLHEPIEMIEHHCEPMTPTTLNDEISSTSSSITSRSTITTTGASGRRSEYQLFLQDCFDSYCQQRKMLILPMLQQNISELANREDLIPIVRNGCSVLIQICIHEARLFSRLFQSASLRSSFRSLIRSFSNILYESLRSVVIQEDNIEVLASCVEVLRREILRDAIRPKRDLLRYFEPVVHHMIQDVQERLIFRSSMYIRENIQLFQPTDSDLNYPQKLQEASSEQSSLESQQESSSALDKEASTLYSDWYPPLARSLSLLSKLYNRIEIGVFEGLAQEVVSLCTKSFIEASQQIAERASILDAELFLIKHLLALRMELTPFEKLKFTTVETSLDFSHLKEGVMRFLKGQATFRMKELIFDIMSQSQPRIIHNAVDSKKDLEKQLKSVYDSFILNVTRLCFEDLMILVKKLHATEGGASAGVTADNVQQVFDKSINNLCEVLLKKVTPKMQLYIQHHKTQLELFKGMKMSLLGVYKQFLVAVVEERQLTSSESVKTVDELSELIEEYCPKEKVVLNE